ncbi:Molybdopterin or thiamine biosynthesis adenylyltransferase [Thermoactinomyces sp. DSM 45892]|nr:Molybdopterin or thiamine biosynthesis adenylyltransferase [Thermoactinomyces sp. DSM 45892]
MITERYSRQERFGPIGIHGQAILKKKHVLIIGMGALGSSLSEMLTRSGVGTITIVDRDYVELSNLQRQTLYTEQDVAERLPKVIAAKNRLKQMNSEVMIYAYVSDVTADNIFSFVEHVDLIFDATDNFETRFLINDVSQKKQIPWIYGACVGSYGVTYSILPRITPCLRCLLEDEPIASETCDTAGIIAPAVQRVVAEQVTEAFKILLGHTKHLRQKLYSFDVWKNEVSAVPVGHLKRKDCPSCGPDATYPTLQTENKAKITALCGRDTVQIRSLNHQVFDLTRLQQLLQKEVEHFHSNDYLLTFKVHQYRFVVFRDGRVLIHGIHDTKVANNLYQKYIAVYK